jgi:hypothetical protein
MKHIKLFREFFDSSDLKDKHEIEYLQGNLKPSEISNIRPNELNRLLNKLAFQFPFFKECTKNGICQMGNNLNDPQTKCFIFKNNKWETSLFIRNMGSDYTISIKRQGINTVQTKENTIVSYNPSEDYNPDKVFFLVIKNVDDLDIIDVVNKHFVPMLKKTGFNDIISSYGVGKFDTLKN